jgi:hypothetical protein
MPEVRFPAGERFFSSQRSDQLWSPPSVLYIGYKGYIGRTVKLSTHIHLVSMSRMVELYLCSPICLHDTVFKLRIGKTLTFFYSCMLILLRVAPSNLAHVVTFLVYIRRCPVQILACIAVTLTDFSCGFPKSLLANAGIIH